MPPRASKFDPALGGPALFLITYVIFELHISAKKKLLVNDIITSTQMLLVQAKKNVDTRHCVAAAVGFHPTSPTHAKNLSPRPPVAPSASKSQKNLSASLADCNSFPDCSPALTQRGLRGSPTPENVYTFLPAWKRKSLNEIERIKSRREGTSGSYQNIQESSRAGHQQN